MSITAMVTHVLVRLSTSKGRKKPPKPRPQNRISVPLNAPANEDTLLPTQMFPRLPARATFVADTNFVSGTQKMFLILFRNILCPQQMFPSLRSPRNNMSNNVSATMCPRLPVPLGVNYFQNVRRAPPSFIRVLKPSAQTFAFAARHIISSSSTRLIY